MDTAKVVGTVLSITVEVVDRAAAGVRRVFVTHHEPLGQRVRVVEFEYLPETDEELAAEWAKGPGARPSVSDVERWGRLSAEGLVARHRLVAG